MARNREQRRNTSPKKEEGNESVRANIERTSDGVRLTPARPGPSRPATAAAAAEAPPLPPAVEILRGALAAAKLEARWDRLTGDELDEISDLVAAHGDSALVKSAVASHRPEKPAAFAQAWLGQWRALTPPGELRLIKDDPCPTHGTPGTVRHCIGCAADALAADA